MLDILPFSDAFVPAAAALLATRYQRERAQAPALVARFADVSNAQETVQALWGLAGTSGVVALRGTHVRGFLFGQVTLPTPASLAALFLYPRSLCIPYAGHALDPDGGADLYPLLYAAAAPAWLAAGCSFHVITIPAGAQQSLDTWFSLGFGQRDAFAMRETTPLSSVTPSAQVLTCRRADPSDQDAVRRLLTDLYRHGAGAPTWIPFLPEAMTSIVEDQVQMLSDRGRVYWLGVDGVHAVGLQAVNLPDYPASVWDIGGPGPAPHVDMAVTAPEARGRGIGTGLLTAVLAAAHGAGQPWCTVSWQTANFLADRFWRRQGFQPLHYQLARTIDQRVAWASGTRLS